MPEVVKEAAWLKGSGAEVGPWRTGATCSAGIAPRCRWRTARTSSPARQAKTARRIATTRSGERPRRPESSGLLRFLVTSPQKSRASEATPANPARVMSTLSTTDAGPRRSAAAPGPCCQVAPMTASRMSAATRANPTANPPDRGSGRRGTRAAVASALGDACIVNTLRAASAGGRRGAEMEARQDRAPSTVPLPRRDGYHRTKADNCCSVGGPSDHRGHSACARYACAARCRCG